MTASLAGGKLEARAAGWRIHNLTSNQHQRGCNVRNTSRCPKLQKGAYESSVPTFEGLGDFVPKEVNSTPKVTRERNRLAGLVWGSWLPVPFLHCILPRPCDPVIHPQEDLMHFHT